MNSKNKPRILYVEDHVDTRELVRVQLGGLYETVDVPDVASALRVLNTQVFDLFILDSWLPDGSGLELCKQIHQAFPMTPILFYSAAAYDVDRIAALAAGAHAYLVKPASQERMLELIRSLLERAMPVA